MVPIEPPPPDIARHILQPGMAHAGMTSDGHSASEIEIAEGDDHKRFTQAGSLFPIIDRRQILANKSGESHRLEPTDAGNRMLALPLWIGSSFPRSRARLARLVLQLG